MRCVRFSHRKNSAPSYVCLSVVSKEAVINFASACYFTCDRAIARSENFFLLVHSVWHEDLRFLDLHTPRKDKSLGNSLHCTSRVDLFGIMHGALRYCAKMPDCPSGYSLWPVEPREHNRTQSGADAR